MNDFARVVLSGTTLTFAPALRSRSPLGVIRYRLLRAENRSMSAMLRKLTQRRSLGICHEGSGSSRRGAGNVPL